jgi:hypothetical protein
MRKLRPFEVGGGSLLQKILERKFIAYFLSPQKILKNYSVAFRVERLFVELKMAISKQFKLLNLNNK